MKILYATRNKDNTVKNLPSKLVFNGKKKIITIL